MRKALCAALHGLLGCGVLVGCGPTEPPPLAAAQDNVLLVTLDTTRADHLGCYGHLGAHTPTIDRLAAEGVSFERALTVTPVTLPSHTSILTGLYPIDHGVRDNGIFRVEDSVTTLAEVLQASGYQTAAFVSTYILSQPYGLAQGFDHFEDQMLASGGRAMGNVERRAAQTVNAALEWLAAAPPEPWFAWVHFYDPHHPYSAPGGDPAWPGEPYDREIAYVDGQLARLLHAWSDAERLQRTLVVLTADHGEGLGDHGEDVHGLFLYDSTMHVPLIFRHPRLSAGARIGGQVSVVDIAPTILDFLALAPLERCAGTSLMPWLRGGESSPPWHDAYLETQLTYYYLGLAAVDAVSSSDHKYIAAPRPEFYRRGDDPGEVRDLHEAGGPELDRHLELLGQMRAGRDPLATGPNRTLSQGELLQLAALGYVTEASQGATSVDPKDYLHVIELREQARTAMREKRLVDAEASVQEALRICPEDATTRGLLGEVFLNQDRVEEAIPLLEASLKRRPDMAGAAQNLARAHKRLGHLSQALSAYEVLLDWTPDVVSAVFEAFDVSVLLEDRPRAAAFLERLDGRPHLTTREQAQLEARRAALARMPDRP